MNIHQEIQFSASAEKVFGLLIEPQKFAQVTGAKAQIDSKAGGQFSLFNGMIKGMNIEIIQNELLVQAWQPANWPRGVYSIVKFELLSEASDSTKLILEQSGFPEEFEQHLSEGWQQKYWLPMQTFLGSSPDRK